MQQEEACILNTALGLLGELQMVKYGTHLFEKVAQHKSLKTFQTADVRATGRESFSSAALAFFGTGTVVLTLRIFGTLHSLSER